MRLGVARSFQSPSQKQEFCMSRDYFTQHVIAGKKRDASDGALFDKFEPSTGMVLARVAAGTSADVDAAVAAARAQFDAGAWSKLPGAARAKMLYRLADLLERETEKFVEILAREQGRPVMEMRMLDLPMSIDT